MIDSMPRKTLRPTRALALCGIAACLLASACSSKTSAATNPTISAKASRSSTGALEELKVTGKGFSANGQVHITVLMAASGPNTSPYVEEDVQADANGKITYDKKPLPCPTVTDYGHGSWTAVSARDTSSQIASTAVLNPGKAPDCGS
jgi:hypothetical protein